MMRLLAFLTGRRIVYLQDRNGRVYKSSAKLNPWGELSCPVYFWTSVGQVTLLPDGSTAGDASYVRRWKFG